MKGVSRIQWISILLSAFCLTACQVKRPKTVISDAKMESVLYDYHIAKAMGEQVPYSENYKKVLYIESVFEKHDITQAVFDSSMAWFTRNPEVLTKIYEKVSSKLKAERDDINNLIAIRDNKPKESMPGDSIDVWIWQRIHQLTGLPLDNKITFVLPTDTNFKDRDTLQWNVHFHFYNDEVDSMHAPIMTMQMVYKNDSIISGVQKVYNSGMESISLYADTLGEIKEVRGSIYYPTTDITHSLLAHRISLMRYHATDTLTFAKNDSIKDEKKVDDILPKKEYAKTIDKKEEDKTEEKTNENSRIRSVNRPRISSPEKTIKKADRMEKLELNNKVQ